MIWPDENDESAEPMFEPEVDPEPKTEEFSFASLRAVSKDVHMSAVLQSKAFCFPQTLFINI